MFFNNRNILLLLPTCLVLISYVYAYPDRYGEKRVDLKIGFDLTQEVNGEPALRVREFEESGNYPRAVESAEDKDKPAKHIRADSFSASEEETTTVKEVVKEKKSKRVREREHEREKESEHERERESSKESKASKDSDESDSDDDKIKSTQGVRAGEFDPDDSGKVHGRDADADSEGNGR